MATIHTPRSTCKKLTATELDVAPLPEQPSNATANSGKFWMSNDGALQFVDSDGLAVKVQPREDIAAVLAVGNNGGAQDILNVSGIEFSKSVLFGRGAAAITDDLEGNVCIGSGFDGAVVGPRVLFGPAVAIGSARNNSGPLAYKPGDVAIGGTLYNTPGAKTGYQSRGSIAIGNSHWSNSSFRILSNGIGTIAVGFAQNVATGGNYSIAIGSISSVNQPNQINLDCKGYTGRTRPNAPKMVIIGSQISGSDPGGTDNTTRLNSIGIGTFTNVTQPNAVVIGEGAVASFQSGHAGDTPIVIGQFAWSASRGQNSIVIGQGSSAQNESTNSIVIGQNQDLNAKINTFHVGTGNSRFFESKFTVATATPPTPSAHAVPNPVAFLKTVINNIAYTIPLLAANAT